MKPILYLTLFSVVACTSDEGVKVYNNDPEATITSHATGSDLLEAVEYTFVGQVSDGNHGMSELKVEWSTDTRDLCPDLVPDASGVTSCVATLETNDTQIKLQVTDPEGSAALSSIDVKVLETAAPTIELISPVVGGSYDSDQLIQFAAIIGDLEDDPADLVYTWSNVHGELSVGNSVDSDGSISGWRGSTPFACW